LGAPVKGCLSDKTMVVVDHGDHKVTNVRGRY
jgi:hypothetical protein